MSKTAEFREKVRQINRTVEELWGCTPGEIDHLYRLLVARNALKARFHATKDKGSGETNRAVRRELVANGAEMRSYLEGITDSAPEKQPEEWLSL